MTTKHDVLQAFYEGGHLGAARGISAVRLAARLDCEARFLRELISDLRRDGVLICGHPREGYYIAQTMQEVLTTCDYLHARALHSLNVESRMRRALTDLAGQLHLPT